MTCVKLKSNFIEYETVFFRFLDDIREYIPFGCAGIQYFSMPEYYSMELSIELDDEQLAFLKLKYPEVLF